MMNQSNLEDLLKSALEECERLRAENAHLRMISGFQIGHLRNPVQRQFLSRSGPRAMLGRLHLKRRLLFFEACFAVARTFTRYAGKERMASLAILPPVPWTGAQSTPQGRGIVRRSHGR